MLNNIPRKITPTPEATRRVIGIAPLMPCPLCSLISTVTSLGHQLDNQGFYLVYVFTMKSPLHPPAVILVACSEWDTFIERLKKWLVYVNRGGLYIACDATDVTIPFEALSDVCLVGVKPEGDFQIGRAFNTAVHVAWRIERCSSMIIVVPLDSDAGDNFQTVDTQCFLRAGGFGASDTADTMLQVINNVQKQNPKGHEAAIELYSEISLQMPKNGGAWYGLGCYFAEQGENARAMHCHSKAVQTSPENARAWHNLGVQLHTLGQADEAFEAWEKALKLENLGLTMNAVAVSIPGFPGVDLETIREARRRYVEYERNSDAPWPTRRPERSSDGRWRIGYLSAFFDKPNWMKPVWGVVNAHDRRRFQVHLLSDGPISNMIASYRHKEDDQLYNITAVRNDELPGMIEGAGIDLLVDLNSYSFTKRLPIFFRRLPVPVVAWFNLYATSALPAVNYLVGDKSVIYPEEHKAYTESVHCLKSSYLAFQPDNRAPKPTEAPYTSKGFVTFGSLCSQYKITNPVLDAWSAVLKRVPTSRLIIRNAAMGRACNRDWLINQFRKRGIRAARLKLLGPTEHLNFIQTYDQIDIALDTFPYSGGTTTMEALWQGVPVLTQRGDRWASRTSASLLDSAGLGEWVAEDVPAFIKLAVTLGSAPEAYGLADRRLSQRKALNKSSLCDSLHLTQQLEEYYETILELTI